MAPKKKPDVEESTEREAPTSKRVRMLENANKAARGSRQAVLRRVDKGKGEKRSRDDEEEPAGSAGQAEDIAATHYADYGGGDGFELAIEEQGLESGEDDAREQLQLQANKSAGAGIIEKLVARDFMCHDNLEVTFKPNLNFITGANGST
jgi:hypothetical protein